MRLWSILEKSRMSPKIVSSVSPLSRIVSANSLIADETVSQLWRYGVWQNKGEWGTTCVATQRGTLVKHLKA